MGIFIGKHKRSTSWVGRFDPSNPEDMKDEKSFRVKLLNYKIFWKTLPRVKNGPQLFELLMSNLVERAEENENLKSEINNLNNEMITYQTEISQKQEQIKQFDIDKSELEFLRLNLEYSHKCRKSFFNVKGFSILFISAQICKS